MGKTASHAGNDDAPLLDIDGVTLCVNTDARRMGTTHGATNGLHVMPAKRVHTAGSQTPRRAHPAQPRPLRCAAACTGASRSPNPAASPTRAHPPHDATAHPCLRATPPAHNRPAGPPTVPQARPRGRHRWSPRQPAPFSAARARGHETQGRRCERGHGEKGRRRSRVAQDTRISAVHFLPAGAVAGVPAHQALPLSGCAPPAGINHPGRTSLPAGPANPATPPNSPLRATSPPPAPPAAAQTPPAPLRSVAASPPGRRAVR